MPTPNLERFASRLATHQSGLLVPADLQRRRLVVTKDEWRILTRAMTVFTRLDALVGFFCKQPTCTSPRIVRAEDTAGNHVLRCACTDRILTRAF